MGQLSSPKYSGLIKAKICKEKRTAKHDILIILYVKKILIIGYF